MNLFVRLLLVLLALFVIRGFGLIGVVAVVGALVWHARKRKPREGA